MCVRELFVGFCVFGSEGTPFLVVLKDSPKEKNTFCLEQDPMSSLRFEPLPLEYSGPFRSPVVGDTLSSGRIFTGKVMVGFR